MCHLCREEQVRQGSFFGIHWLNKGNGVGGRNLATILPSAEISSSSFGYEHSFRFNPHFPQLLLGGGSNVMESFCKNGGNSSMHLIGLHYRQVIFAHILEIMWSLVLPIKTKGIFYAWQNLHMHWCPILL